MNDPLSHGATTIGRCQHCHHWNDPEDTGRGTCAVLSGELDPGDAVDSPAIRIMEDARQDSNTCRIVTPYYFGCYRWKGRERWLREPEWEGKK